MPSHELGHEATVPPPGFFVSAVLAQPDVLPVDNDTGGTTNVFMEEIRKNNPDSFLIAPLGVRKSQSQSQSREESTETTPPDVPIFA